MRMFPVLLELKPEGNHWLARCAALDVITQGATVDEATRNLDEALILFVESCLRRGVLETVLKDAGITSSELEPIHTYIREVLPDAWEAAQKCRA